MLLTQQCTTLKANMEGWEMKHDLLKDELASLSLVRCEMLADMICLQEEANEWKSTAEDMRQDYEDTIYSVTPNTIGKHWVKHVDKQVASTV